MHMRVVRGISSHSTALQARAARLLFLLLGRLLQSQHRLYHYMKHSRTTFILSIRRLCQMVRSNGFKPRAEHDVSDPSRRPANLAIAVRCHCSSGRELLRWPTWRSPPPGFDLRVRPRKSSCPGCVPSTFFCHRQIAYTRRFRDGVCLAVPSPLTDSPV
ncbi:hypothetical protein BU23DRAFT_552171 [Bimuria novae-zelandiae CBS 107.79]|uniref:Uncharacterized protein n=1 Tax=Bimuria novae-zelandiae CBS 107.79 TaxID=1447943 RepID=A0A6A5VGX4_9PLEO|nr:hypothetical protein BU23DRAFT_552171 [Bimuria novae-zelandiae CBS 107.79]